MDEWQKRRSCRPRFIMEVKSLNGKRGVESGTYILDITPDGAQMETDIFMQVGETVDFDVLLDSSRYNDKTEKLDCSGKVVWSKKINSRYRYGIEFNRFSEVDMAKLLDNFRPKYF